MSDFAEWLAEQSDQDPSVKALKAFANSNPANWPSGSNDLVAYQTAVVAAAPADSRDQLLTTLGRYYERWFQAERQGLGKPFGAAIVDHADLIALFVGGMIIAAALIYGIFIRKDFLTLLGDPNNARGLITFLFAFATICVVVLVAVALFWMEQHEIETRFAKAKDLLTILVGILGTIIGFYFGTAGSPPATPMTVSPITVAPKEGIAGENITVSAKITGGTGPYDYNILITDKVLGETKMDVREKKTATGDIAEPIPVPKDAKPGSVVLKISAKDAKGARGESPDLPLALAKPPTQPSTPPATQPSTPPATQPNTPPATQPNTPPATQPSTAPATPPSAPPATK